MPPRAEPEQPSAEGDLPAQVDAGGSSCGDAVVQGRLRDLLDGEGRVCLRDRKHPLERDVILLEECRQALVAGHDVGQSRFKCGRIEFTFKTHGQRYVVRGRWAF